MEEVWRRYGGGKSCNYILRTPKVTVSCFLGDGFFGLDCSFTTAFNLRLVSLYVLFEGIYQHQLLLSTNRSTRPEVFCKKGVLRNFAEFRGKHLHQSIFFNKVAGLRPGTLLTKRLWYRCFPVNFLKFLRTPFIIEHLSRLLLYQR